MRIRVAIEPDRAGTGGALWHARALLQDRFFLLNGDTWFDIPILSLSSAFAQMSDDVLGVVALRHVADASRYGAVTIERDVITGFSEKNPVSAPGYINAGVYFFSKAILDFLGPTSSLEIDVFSVLAPERRLRGIPFDQAYFIDIGIPETYAAAQHDISAQRRRPAAFLDRDGVLNEGLEYVGTRERFHLTDGAVAAVARLNMAGYYVFLVTNQAGIGRGYYTEDEYHDLMRYLGELLAKGGAYIDDQRHCPFHPDAIVEPFKGQHPWRKPQPGMLLDLMEQWPIDRARSFIIGDRDIDLAAGAAADVRGYLFSSGNLDAFVAEVLAIEQLQGT